MLSMRQAKQLKPGDILYHVWKRNADGTPMRWRVSGQVKTWKRSPGRVQVPLKHGLRGHDYLTEDTLHLLSSTEKQALRRR